MLALACPSCGSVWLSEELTDTTECACGYKYPVPAQDYITTLREALAHSKEFARALKQECANLSIIPKKPTGIGRRL